MAMFRAIIAVGAALLSLTAAKAGPGNRPVIGADGHTVTLVRSRADAGAARTPKELRAANVIFDNIGNKYPLGKYWCCSGVLVTGPNAVSGVAEYWEAGAFTPASDATIGEIDVAMSYISGDGNFTLSLQDDRGGLPGPVVQSWALKNVAAYGSCCDVSARKHLSVPVIGGKQYWIVVSTKRSSDSYGVWDRNDTDQVNPVNRALWCYDPGGSCGANNKKWAPINDPPAPAFSVFAAQ